ncbi:hypothetical protein OS493_000778 [Desmophyllum pertusum]|uniref:Uncharacterized protein n=1 Tax=Desmophyllum pertusum TaxID=174260 RepID=A0A9W9ZT82_9CNID|nr:hypothetical protein OS493_000778 [Desmophyllum pertusum]
MLMPPSRSNSNQVTCSSLSHRNRYLSHCISYQCRIQQLHPIQMGSGFFAGATIGSFTNCTFNVQLMSEQLCTTETTEASEASNSSAKRPRIESGG